MARPSKPVAVLESEKKSHRTKAELEARKKAEEAVLSGSPLFERTEVRRDKTAHAEFLRISELMRGIEKDDALYSAGINTYCQLYSEINDLEKLLKKQKKLVAQLWSEFNKIEEKDFEKICRFTDKINRLESIQLNMGSQIDQKRRIMLSIDKENVMTIAAALRSIPKTPEKVENPILKALMGDDDE